MLQKYIDTLHKVKDGSKDWETDKTKCRIWDHTNLQYNILITDKCRQWGGLVTGWNPVFQVWECEKGRHWAAIQEDYHCLYVVQTSLYYLITVTF